MLFAYVCTLHGDTDAGSRIGEIMEEFKNAVLAICIVSAAVSIIGNLVSGARLRNQIQLLLNLVLVVVVITSFIRGASELELPDVSRYDSPDHSYSLELYNENLRRTVSENISVVLSEQLAAAGIKCEKIETEINISEDGGIFISRVALSADNFKAAAEVVRNSLGAETEVVDQEEQ